MLPFRSIGLLGVLSLVLTCATAAPTFAQMSYTWKGTNVAPTNWGTDPTPGANTNWPNGSGTNPVPANTAPASNLDNVLIFPGSVIMTTTNDNAGNFQLNQILWQNTFATTSSVITGGTIEFVNSSTGAPPQIVKGTGLLTITSNLVLTGNLKMTGAGTNSLNYGSNTDGTVGIISGPGSLQIDNYNGNVPIYGNNTYQGGTIFTGTVNPNPGISIGNQSCFGTGPLQIGDGVITTTKIIRLANNGVNGTHTVVMPNALSIRTNFTYNDGTIADATLSWGGNVDLFNGTRTITNNGTKTTTTSTFFGVISDGPGVGPGGFTKAGARTINFAGANTYTGNTTITAGTLALTGTGSIATSPQISIAATTIFDVSGVTGGANFNATTNSFAVAANQAMAGGGKVIGTAAIPSGATVAAASNTGGIGTLTTDKMFWLPGGNDTFLHDPGSSSSSLINSTTGALDLSQLSAANKFTLTVAPTLPFPATPTVQTYTLATFSGGILGPGATPFNDQDNVSPLFTPAGGFTSLDPANFVKVVGVAGGVQSLQITFTPVPEPGFVLICCCAAASGLRWRRRT